MESIESKRSYLTFGMYSAFLLSFLTIVTFGFAMIAIPPSGPYCPGNCMEYPFTDLLLYYPRDYYWMYLVIFQLFAFVVFIVTNHYNTLSSRRLFTLLSISFTLISSTVLLIAYFTQFSVVPISVMKGETDGIALLTQYNDHGLFIAMEELGYITMSIALFFLAFAFPNKPGIERLIRLILFLQISLNILAFIFYSVKFGLERSYRFEVSSITINWLAIIVVGVLAGLFYYKNLRQIKLKV